MAVRAIPSYQHIHRPPIGSVGLLRNRPTQTTDFSRHRSRSRRTSASSSPHRRNVNPLVLIAVAGQRNQALQRWTQGQHTARRYGATSTFPDLSISSNNRSILTQRQAADNIWLNEPSVRPYEAGDWTGEFLSGAG